MMLAASTLRSGSATQIPDLVIEAVFVPYFLLDINWKPYYILFNLSLLPDHVSAHQQAKRLVKCMTASRRIEDQDI